LGRRFSFAISADEELGKFLIALFVAVGHTPPDGLLRMRRDHKPKQALGIAISRATAILDIRTLQFAKAVDLRGVAPVDFFSVLNERLAAAVHEVRLDGGALDATIAESNAAARGVHERLRQSGIYVDFLDTEAGWRITSPAQVSAEDARREIDSVSSVFACLADMRLPGVREPWDCRGIDPRLETGARSLRRACLRRRVAPPPEAALGFREYGIPTAYHPLVIRTKKATLAGGPLAAGRSENSIAHLPHRGWGAHAVVELENCHPVLVVLVRTLSLEIAEAAKVDASFHCVGFLGRGVCRRQIGH
jgi:hypothetical protein